MKRHFVNNRGLNYISHVYIGKEKIIPSDSFNIGENEYILLEILKSTEDMLFLKIMGIEGHNMGNQYIVPKHIFEGKTLNQIKEYLKNYQY